MNKYRQPSLCLGLAAALFLSPGLHACGKEAPNFVFILVDDLRWDVLSCMGHPVVKTPNIDRLAEEGAIFDNAFTTVSLCSPSRAGFLTGTYPQLNGVIKNGPETQDPLGENMGQLLHEAGYETAFMGKWHIEIKPDPRPGFDYWLSFPGQGVYNDPVFNINGETVPQQGYMTELLTDYAVDWLRKGRNKKKPFLLYLSHKAVHVPLIPADEDRNHYLDAVEPPLPTWHDTLEGKPEWQRAAWAWGHLREPWMKNRNQPVPDRMPPKVWKEKPNDERLRYYQTLDGVDESVRRVLEALEQTGELDNTVIIFASDNGMNLPEMGRIRTDKRVAHEESIRIAFLMRYPQAIPAGSHIDEMVLNIDLLPTMLDFAGAPEDKKIQGRSFKPLLTGEDVPWRTEFLYQYYMEDWVPGIPSVQAVRSEDWVYMTYPDITARTEPYKTLQDMDELYDLRNDPYELHNLAEDPAFRGQLELMRKRMKNLQRTVTMPGKI